MSENYDQSLDAVFDCVSESFRPNFAIRDYVHRKIVEKYRLLSLFVLMPCHIHRLEVRGQSATPTANGQLDLRSRPPFTGVLLGPGPESAPRSAFWAILGTCLGVPQRVLFECFLAFLGPKNAKKHSKSTLWGTPRQVPKIAQKALRGALSGPGPKSTPVNGGRDRKTRP